MTWMRLFSYHRTLYRTIESCMNGVRMWQHYCASADLKKGQLQSIMRHDWQELDWYTSYGPIIDEVGTWSTNRKGCKSPSGCTLSFLETCLMPQDCMWLIAFIEAMRKVSNPLLTLSSRRLSGKMAEHNYSFSAYWYNMLYLTWSTNTFPHYRAQTKIWFLMHSFLQWLILCFTFSLTNSVLKSIWNSSPQ